MPKPREDFNVFDCFRENVKEKNINFQINWIRFEYIRRNENYRKEWECFSCNFSLSFDEKIAIKKKILIRKMEYLKEFLEKWSIHLFPFPPEYPLPRIGFFSKGGESFFFADWQIDVYEDKRRIRKWVIQSSENTVPPSIVYPNNYRPKLNWSFTKNPATTKKPITLICDDGEKIDLTPYHDEKKYCISIYPLLGYVISKSEVKDFQSVQPIKILKPCEVHVKGKKDINNLILLENSIHKFELFRKNLKEFEIDWDTENWALVAINKNASRKQIVETLDKEKIFNMEQRGKGFDPLPHLKRLRAYDLKKNSNMRHLNIAEELFNECHDLKYIKDKEIPSGNQVSRLIKECDQYIQGKYQLIK